MRKLLLLILPAFALAQPALADLAPPVQVRLASGFAAARAGEDVTATLEITCLEAGRLSDLGLAGDGWTVNRLDAPAARGVAKGEVVTVTFVARPADPAQRLVFECQLDGRAFRYGMDFSPANVRRMSGPLPTVELPGGRGRVPARDDLDKTGRGLVENAPAPAADARRTITVHGRFVYNRSDGMTMPAHSIRVQVWDQDPIGGDDLLGEGYTNWDGYYSIAANSDLSGETQPDIYCIYELSNGRVEVVEPTSGARYAWGSSVVSDVSGSDVDFGWLLPADESLQAAVHVHTNVSRIWVFDSNAGYDLPFVTCQWPSSNWTSYWAHVIYVNALHEWQEGTFAHEYGHFFDDEFSGIEPFDYCNGICDSPPDCGHCFWCEESSVIAWLEGWANYHGYSFSAWYPGYYGVDPIGPLSVESLGDCGGSYDPPNITEGHCAALLQDIEDSAQDSHGVYGPWTDALAIGRDEIFTVCDLDNPNGPSDFIAKFRARYPGLTYWLWETGANCGYDYDTTAPGAVFNLTSPSHPIGVNSPDPTITYTWTPPNEDYSGIAGYGLWIWTSAGLPSAVQDIGAVTTYTTDPLAPGTYYFSIRAVDRAGNWSGSYASYGPVTIHDPEPADLTSYQAALWDYPLVPRSTTGATFDEAHVTATLPGYGNTYWNLRGLNQGEVTTSSGFYGWLNVDGVYGSGAYWGPIWAGGHYYATNWGPVTVPGGRHSFTFRHDATDLVFENDETNNVWGRQFIWSPTTMPVATAVTRNAPNHSIGGWSDVTSGPLYYNCDGLRIAASSAGWWNAAVVWPVNPADDFDCRQHPATTGAQDGFGASNAASYRGAGLLDAVVTNRNVVSGDWDAGILNYYGTTNQYRVYHATSSIISFGDSLNVALAADQPLLLREFYVGPTQAGPVSVTVAIDPAQGPVTVQWLPRTYTYGILTSGYGASASTNPAGFARITTTASDAGWYAILVYREPGNGLPAMNLTYEVDTTPPDLTYWTPGGWHSPFVPRPAFDGTPTSVPLPDTLYCSPGSTYLNLAVQNTGPVASAIPNGMYLDDGYLGWINWPVMPAGAQVSFNWNYGFWWFTGGRHVLSMHSDPDQTIEETSETNNIWGEPWVWGPTELSPGTTAAFGAPPGQTAGWNDVTSGETLWYTCDGLRLPLQSSHWWFGLAVMPAAATADVDVRLHAAAAGTKDGFAANLGRSGWSTGLSDYVLVNFNQTTWSAYDVGVLNPGGSGDSYGAHAAGSVTLGGNSGTYGPYTLAPDQILGLYEFYLPPETYRMTLLNLAGNADLGLSLHRSDAAYQTKSSALAQSWVAPAGANEELVVDITTPGWYALAVWKSGSADLATNASYSLELLSSVTAVEAGLPAVTRIAGVQPNPFNPRTEVAFDLARPGRVDLAIYDIQGRLVRRLLRGDLPAGRHTEVWEGRDDAGHQMASGVYFARLEADGVIEMSKLVLVK